MQAGDWWLPPARASHVRESAVADLGPALTQCWRRAYHFIRWAYCKYLARDRERAVGVSGHKQSATTFRHHEARGVVMKLRHLVVCGAWLLWSAAQGADLSQTVLGRLAATLKPGQASRVVTKDYDALPWPPNVFYYGDGAAWNPIKQRIEFVASPTGGKPRYRHVYDLASDHWSAELVPWQGNGHGYDSNAVDEHGRHCFAKYSGGVVCREEDGSWVELPPAPWQPGTVQALETFPGRGLVLVNRSGLVALWDGRKWMEIPGAAESWGNTGTWATTVGKAVYLGAGAAVFRLDCDLKLERMPDPPWPMGNNQALHTTDGSRLLVARLDGAAWLQFDGTTWTERPDLVSGAVINLYSDFITYIPELSAIVTMTQRASDHQMWMLKVANANAGRADHAQCPEQGEN